MSSPAEYSVRRIALRNLDLRSGTVVAPPLGRKENTMKQRIIAAAIALGALTAAAPAQADVRVGIQIGPSRGGYNDRGRFDARRIAFDNGYRDGLREGNRDDRRDDRYSYRDERRYREGDAGYRREYGSRYEYASAYRRGFEDGYRQGYANRRNDRRGYRR